MDKGVLVSVNHGEDDFTAACLGRIAAEWAIGMLSSVLIRRSLCN